MPISPEERLRLVMASAEEKAAFIDKKLAEIEKLLDRMGGALSKDVVDRWMNELSIENGLVLSDAQNLRKSALLSSYYAEFMEQKGYRIVTTMIADLYAISGLNLDYFETLQGMKINPGQINNIVNARLGLNDKGELKKDGFMKGLMDSNEVRDKIINYAYEKTLGGSGFDDLKKGFKTLINGDAETMGAFKQYYRNAAYDTYTRIDALNGKLYADKLKFNYFIYAGTRRKASRHFCVERKGKVFSREEAEKWKDLIDKTKIIDGKRVKIGPMVTKEDVPTYNPLIDRGGYGCVDDINWISDALAYVKRPDLRPKE